MKTLKYEEVQLWNYEKKYSLKERIPEFLENVYNKKRLHPSLDYLTPAEFEGKIQTQKPVERPILILWKNSPIEGVHSTSRNWIMISISAKKKELHLLNHERGKELTRFAAFGILFVVGYFQYIDSYEFPKWKVFLSGVIMGTPFSLGIFLSTLPIGKRFKFFFSILILFLSIARSLLLVPPPSSVLILIIELYAIGRLFIRGKVEWKIRWY